MAEILSLSASMQDYLEAILELDKNKASVRITDIANKLNIAKASVNQTVSKLKDIGLVRQEVYGPVELTDSGREMADKIRLRHIKLRQFLIEAIGVDPKTAEDDACRMEHAVSVQTMNKLTEYLFRNGYMTEGNTIMEYEGSGNINKESSAGGKEEASEYQPIIKALSELKTGQKGKVARVVSKGVVRKRIIEMGITTGTEVVVKGFAPFGDPMELGVKGYNLSLRKAEAADIFIEVL